MGIVAFTFIVKGLGGIDNAAKVTARVSDNGTLVQDYAVNKKTHVVEKLAQPKMVATIVAGQKNTPAAGRQPHLTRGVLDVEFTHPKTKKTIHREIGMPPLMFLSYLLIPMSVGMFPHLFQHWLTARSARAFKLTLVAHPIFIMIVWVPCVLIGVWATGILGFHIPPAAVLSNMLKGLVGSDVLTGFLTAGILAAIMSSLDSQFLCLGTMFTNDIVLNVAGKDRFTDKQVIWIARWFIIAIVAITYIVAMIAINSNVFDLAVWCFSGFAALTPVVIAALYWKRANKYGAFAAVTAVVATWVYFFVTAYNETGQLGGEYTLFGGVMPVVFCFLAGVVSMFVVSLITPKPREATIRKFFPESL
jgi:SSS family solute:Na+ symporter